LGASFQIVLTDCHMPNIDGFQFVKRLRSDPKTESLKVIMLTSGVVPSSRLRCEELGISDLLMKPVKPSELLNAMLTVLGDSVESTESTGIDDQTGPQVERLSVLLAEDNLVNQMLALRMLEKQGHTVEVANNGREALDKVSTQSFDLILMDVQMPIMDGYEATEAIRKQEQQSGKRVPIIALTAHAMKGDKEKCLESGMDDYIAKPFRQKEFATVVHRVMSSRKR